MQTEEGMTIDKGLLALENLLNKRDEYLLQIQFDKREEKILNKRKKDLEKRLITGNEEWRNLVKEWRKQTFDPSNFQELVDAIHSNDRPRNFYGLIGLNKIANQGSKDFIQLLIDTNLVPRLVLFMLNFEDSNLQIEALFLISFISSGTSKNIQSIINADAIDCFIKLLATGIPIVIKQIISVIGNIAQDSSKSRDLLLMSGILFPLLEAINYINDESLRKEGIWVLSNLCRGKPVPDFKLIEPIIPTLWSAMQKEKDLEILQDIAWALSFHCKFCPQLDYLVTEQLLSTLVSHMDNPHMTLAIACLKIFQDILNISENLMNMALRHSDFLPKLFRLLQHNQKSVRRETCLLFSVIAQKPNQVEVLMKNPYNVDMLINCLLTDISIIQREVIQIFLNSTGHDNANLTAELVERGLLDTFLLFLDSLDARTVELALKGIYNILGCGSIIAYQKKSPDNEFAILLENKQGLDKIEKLQEHPNQDVYECAYRILETYFEIDNII